MLRKVNILAPHTELYTKFTRRVYRTSQQMQTELIVDSLR